jgi:hypothetical protein
MLLSYSDGASNPLGSAPVDDQQMAIYASGSQARLGRLAARGAELP